MWRDGTGCGGLGNRCWWVSPARVPSPSSICLTQGEGDRRTGQRSREVQSQRGKHFSGSQAGGAGSGERRSFFLSPTCQDERPHPTILHVLALETGVPYSRSPWAARPPCVHTRLGLVRDARARARAPMRRGRRAPRSTSSAPRALRPPWRPRPRPRPAPPEWTRIISSVLSMSARLRRYRAGPRPGRRAVDSGGGGAAGGQREPVRVPASRSEAPPRRAMMTPSDADTGGAASRWVQTSEEEE